MVAAVYRRESDDQKLPTERLTAFRSFVFCLTVLDGLSPACRSSMCQTGVANVEVV